MTIQTVEQPTQTVRTVSAVKPKLKRKRAHTVKIPKHIVMRPVQVPEIELPVFDLPYDDGEPLESNWHRAEGSLLIEAYQQYRGSAKDYYAGANMFVYYSSRQVRNQDFRGPDFFIVLGVDGSYDRKSWIVWEENGRYPNVIVELMSVTTADEDRTTKKQLYAQTFGTQNYFYYDPETQEFQGFHLVNGDYEDLLPNAQGWLWCEALDLWVGLWQGEFQGQTHAWVRFYSKAGELVLTNEEAERQRAEAERQRAEAAETALARLHARLRTLGIDPDQA